MYTKILAFFLVSICYFSVNPILAQNEEDYFSRAEFYFDKDLDSSRIYLKKALPNLEKRKIGKSLVECYNGLFAICYYKGEYFEAERYATIALTKANLLLKKEDIAYRSAINNLGSLLYEQRKISNAIEHFKSVTSIKSDDKEDLLFLATIYHNLGNCYLIKGDFNKAQDNFLQALKIRKKYQPKSLAEALNLSSIGSVSKKQKKVYLALNYYQKKFIYI